jgi:hypothetical protein
LRVTPLATAWRGNAAAIKFVGDPADSGDARSFDAFDDRHYPIAESGSATLGCGQAQLAALRDIDIREPIGITQFDASRFGGF